MSIYCIPKQHLVLVCSFGKLDGDINAAREQLRHVFRGKLWRARIINRTDKRQEYADFVRFVTDPPLEGLGATLEAIEIIIDGDMELEGMMEEAVKRDGGRPKTVDNVNGFSERPDGNSSDYALRKLRADAPELHTRVLKGELSPHAAMLEAGLRKKTIQIPADAEGAARAIARRFTPDEIRQIIDYLADRFD